MFDPEDIGTRLKQGDMLANNSYGNGLSSKLPLGAPQAMYGEDALFDTTRNILAQYALLKTPSPQQTYSRNNTTTTTPYMVNLGALEESVNDSRYNVQQINNMR